MSAGETVGSTAPRLPSMAQYGLGSWFFLPATDEYWLNKIDEVEEWLAPTTVIQYNAPPKSLDERGARECAVCMTMPVTTALKPCGHSVLCQRCMEISVQNHFRCPVCRQGIESVYTGFF